jgi:hypothetical protein
MSNDKKPVEIEDILDILKISAENVKHVNFKNERYLHHYFSYLFQKKFDLLNLSKKDKEIMLHPEWPTYRKVAGMNIDCGRYLKDSGHYLIPGDKGGAAHIDFAIGDYKKPYIGIEFKWIYGWDKVSLASDFLKCMDRRNPFEYTISYTVLFRKKSLSKKVLDTSFHKKMNETYDKAVKLLNKNICEEKHELYLIVTEIGSDNNRRDWYLDRMKGKFVEGFPEYKK